ncbi:MAG TPA: hypothetical protein VF444_10535 [Pseudonocardiaceae bacterium]
MGDDPLTNPISDLSVGGSLIGKAVGWLTGTGSSDSAQPSTAAAPAPAVKPEDATAFAQEVQRQTANAQALKTAATAGNFSIHPDAAQAMIKGFQDAQDIWLKNQYNVYRLTSTYKLGSTPGAKVISQWNQQIGQQLATAYAALNDILQTQIDAYTQAMKNYQENEANVSNSLRKSGES